jgi:hypothetical protein
MTYIMVSFRQGMAVTARKRTEAIHIFFNTFASGKPESTVDVVIGTSNKGGLIGC